MLRKSMCVLCGAVLAGSAVGAGFEKSWGAGGALSGGALSGGAVRAVRGGPAPTYEALVEFSFAQVLSFQGEDDPNKDRIVQVLENETAYTVGWSAQLTTFGGSAFGESAIRVTPPGGQQGFFFFPAGAGNAGTGSQHFEGFGALPLPLFTQGQWRFFFYETEDTVKFGADARWNDLTITLGTALDYSGATLGSFETGEGAGFRKRLGRNDGVNYTGFYLGNGSYGGGEDVYRIDHAGGRFEIYLEIFANPEFPGGEGLVINRSDLDLFLLGPTGTISDIVAISANVAGMPGFDESIVLDALEAGTYYVLIDGFAQSVASYSLYTVPSPGGVAALAVGVALLGRGRR